MSLKLIVDNVKEVPVIIPEENENAPERKIVPDLKLITDTGGDTPTSNNWLANLPEGAIFDCVPFSAPVKNYIALRFQILQHTGKTCLLETCLTHETLVVITENFSNANRLVGTLPTEEETPPTP